MLERRDQCIKLNSKGAKTINWSYELEYIANT